MTDPAPQNGSDDASGREQDSSRLDVGAWLWALGLAACFAAAYHALADYTPIPAAQSNRTHVLEGQLFVPNQKPVSLIFGIAALAGLLRAPALLRTFGSDRPALWSGPLLLVATGLNIWSHFVQAPHLGLLSLTLALVASAGLLGGSSGARLAAFPALFPLLALPIPAVVLNRLVDGMQLMAAQGSGWLLARIGVDAQVFGDLIFTATNTFQVIEGCSGLRSTETLLMAALVYQHLIPHSRTVSWLLVGSVPFVGLAVNQLRILWITLRPDADVVEAHATQGLVMIVVGVIVLDRIYALLAKRLPRQDWAPAEANGSTRTGTFRALGIAVAAIVLAGALFTRATPWEIDRPEHQSPNRFPKQIAGYAVEGTRLDREFFGSTRHTQSIARAFRPLATASGDASATISLFAAVDMRKSPLRSGQSPKNLRFTPGQRILDRRPITIGDGEIPALRTIQRSRTELEYVVSFERGAAPFVSEALRNFFVLDRSPWQRPYDATFVRIATPILNRSQASLDAAEARLAPFLDQAVALYASTDADRPATDSGDEKRNAP